MQGFAYWITQYAIAAVTMFAVLIVMDLASGANVREGVWMTLAWSMSAAAIFIGYRYSQSRRR